MLCSYIFFDCMQEVDIQYPKEDYAMTPYTMEFSPPDDGECPYIQLQNIRYQEESGWKIYVIGSKQVLNPNIRPLRIPHTSSGKSIVVKIPTLSAF